jgi:hypothetical protein
VRASRRAAPALVLVVFAALGTACGSGSHEKSTAKVDFIAQADGICGTYNDLERKATKNFKHPGPRQAIATVENKLVPLFQRQNDELARLTPPAADRTTIAQFLADLKAATEEVAVDPEAWIAAHGATPLLRKAAAEAAGYGFAVCARI